MIRIVTALAVAFWATNALGVHAQARIPGWQWRPDQAESKAAVNFDQMPPGWHITTLCGGSPLRKSGNRFAKPPSAAEPKL